MTMSTPQRPARGLSAARPHRSARQTLVPVKMTDAERTRFKVACAEEGNLSYAGLILKLLDERDRRLERQRRAQAHPFHRPEVAEAAAL